MKMRKRAEILGGLYLNGTVALTGLNKALSDGVINQEEYEAIIAQQPSVSNG